MKMPKSHTIATAVLLSSILPLHADGLVVKPRSYEGSLEERAQSAMIVFTPGTEKKSAVQELILKIRVEGDTEEFAWVVPLPSVPQTAKENPKLFEELFRYVEARKRPKPKARPLLAFGGAKNAEATPDAKVEVISREIVGSFDVAVVKEKVGGGLNEWLEKEGYQPVGGAGSKRVLGHYRDKGYVFACVKVSEAALDAPGGAELHPLRFTFETGGRDGIYFPMRLTGLQSERFDVNLYIFYGAWLNDRINGHGYVHRGFELNWRDYDSKRCKPNAGKTWSAPEHDPYLAGYASKIPTLTRYFQKRHPGERFYLTNILARNLRPADVRDWRDDLWMYPYYTDPAFVPYDLRGGEVE
mgnify:CR=1 FL=1